MDTLHKEKIMRYELSARKIRRRLRYWRELHLFINGFTFITAILVAQALTLAAGWYVGANFAFAAMGFIAAMLVGLIVPFGLVFCMLADW